MPRRAAPSWFADPFGHSRFRYWNGEAWTEHVFGPDYGLDPVPSATALERRETDGAWQASFGSLALSIGGLLVAFGLSVLFVLPYLFIHHIGGELVGLSLSEAGLWLGLFGTCLLTSHRYGTGHFRADFRLTVRPIDLVIALVGALAARCIATVVLLPFAHALQSAGNPDKSLYAITGLGGAGWTVLIVLTVIGAPFFEELFFRGVLQGQLAARFGPGVGISCTSVVFGLAHVANDPGTAGLLLALSVGASGVVLGVVRHLTGRLGSSMLTHAMFNAMAVAALFALGS